MKREAVGHTKMKRLCRRLDIPLWQGVGILELLWHVTAREAPRGDIGKLSNEDIALGLDYRGDENKLIEALLSSGWLDTDPKDRIVVHDWHEHADDAVHVRLARAHLFFAVGIPPKLTRIGAKERVTLEAFYTARAQIVNLCAQKADPCALPVPVPVPVPVPGDDVGAAAERMYALHPKKKDLPLLPEALENSARVKPLEEIERVHSLWCATDDWKKNNGRFAPSLPQWLIDRGYTCEPASANGTERKAISAEGVKTRPYDPMRWKNSADA